MFYHFYIQCIAIIVYWLVEEIMKYYMFKFFYKNETILVGIKQEAILLCLKKLGISNSKLEHDVLLGNLSISLYKELRINIKNLSFIDYFEKELVNRSYDKVTLFLTDYELNFEMLIIGNKQLTKDFLMLFHAKQLKLKKLNPRVNTLEDFTLKFNEINYKFTLNHCYYNINSKDNSYTCITLQADSFIEKAYISNHVFTHIINTYYGYKLPIAPQTKFFIDSAICIINFWLSTFKEISLKIIDWQFYKPMYGIYTHIALSSDDFNTDILLTSESRILSILFKDKIVSDSENKLNKVILSQDKVNYPVFSAMYEINKTQLSNLVTNASIFNLSNKLPEDIMIIEIGNVQLLTQYRENKLYVLEKRDL